MKAQDVHGTRLDQFVSSLKKSLSTAGQGQALIAYRQSRPWHVMAYWLRSSGREAGAWFKATIAEHKPALETGPRPVEAAPAVKFRPAIMLGRDMAREKSPLMIASGDAYGALLVENHQLRMLIDHLVRFGPDQLRWKWPPIVGAEIPEAPGALIGNSLRSF